MTTGRPGRLSGDPRQQFSGKYRRAGTRKGRTARFMTVLCCRT